jgi:hypothetical protein
MDIENEKPKPDRKAIMQAARDAMATKRPGISPRARGEEKTLLALNWIYKWGWSSPQTLELVVGSTRSGIGARLVKKKLLTSTRTESGGSVKGIPVFILTLTPEGLDSVERHLEEIYEYELDPYRINQSNLRHYEFAQRATANALASGKIKGYLTEKETSQKSAFGIKQHDIIWINPQDKKIGMEIELSAKWKRKLDIFVYSCIRSLQKIDGKSQVDHIHIVTDSKAIQKRYEVAFKVGQQFSRWEKTERGFFTEIEPEIVPEYVRGKITCEFIKV